MADKKRRRSLRNVFKRPETPPATPSLPSGPPSPVVEKRMEFFTATPDGSENSSPKVRPRTLQKVNRTSVFGSLRSLQSLDEDERVKLTRSDSKASSLNEDGFLPGHGSMGENVILHAEVQFGGTTMFRKRTHYLVLTESYLMRFKTQAKAADLFPILSPVSSRSSVPRNSMSSASSLTDLQMSSHSDITQGTALDQIVAVCRSEDARQTVSVDVSYLDERTSRASSMQLQFTESRDADTWITAIMDTASQARKLQERPLQIRSLEYIARVMESQRDYEPNHCRAFKVVSLHPAKSSSKSSSEDLAKSGTSTCFLAIGINKVHLIPIPHASTRSSSTSLSDYDAPTSYGIVNLSLVKMQSPDTIFRLSFNSPVGGTQTITLASCYAEDIVLWLRYASEFVRPEWTIQPFMFDVPRKLEDKMDPPNGPPEDYNCLERSLVAYCAGYEVDTSRIAYTVDHDCEDAPGFRLLPCVGRDSYSAVELLAIMRALRYNEYFGSISFANIDLRPLRDAYDGSDSDVDAQSTRAGTAVSLPQQANLSLLAREIRTLALKSRRLRRFDFTNAISKSTANIESQDCGIPAALAPLSKKSLTNVDWVVLTGNQLGEADLNHLVDAASERRCHIRALEVGDCGLSVHDVDVLLSTLAVHENTMEVIDISGAQGRFSPELFQRGMGAFAHIRRLNLARCQKTAGPEPLLASDILHSWRLESLRLSQTTLNEQMIEGITSYLSNPKSDTLRELHINQCGLTGKELALILRSMTRQQGAARDMHVNASENRLGTYSTLLAQTIAQNYGPTSLSMRMIDFEKERHFRELVDALAANSTLRVLDISRVSLPFDANDETCEALKEMFAHNHTLEELDISGEHAHLDAARFGIGLNIALLGLRRNRVLKLLRIEHQSLGLQGANTLAGVLEANESLLEIHCEHNEINLQSFTVLVNALRRNKTLLYMPDPSHDKAKSMDKVHSEFDLADRADESKTRSSPKTNVLKKGLNALSHKAIPRPSSAHSHQHRKTNSTVSNISFTDQDIAATLSALEERWQIQEARLQRYLARNYNIAAGIPISQLEELEMEDKYDEGRPTTADSLGRMLAKVKLDRTPTVEKNSLLEAYEVTVDDGMAPLHHHQVQPKASDLGLSVPSATERAAVSPQVGTSTIGNFPRKNFLFELPEEE